MIAQAGIALTGTVAIFLTQSKSAEARRYACLFGMAGQPFWMYETFVAAQWGMFALTFLYALAWAKGIYQHWLK